METLYNKILIPHDELTFEHIDTILTFIAQEFVSKEKQSYTQEDLNEVAEYITFNTSEIFDISEQEATNLIMLHSYEKSKRKLEIRKL